MSELRKLVLKGEGAFMDEASLRALMRHIGELTGENHPNCSAMPCVCRLDGKSDKGCPYKI
jgi:hypothetical protein